MTEELFETKLFNPKTYGPKDAPIVVVCEPEARADGKYPMDLSSMSTFLSEAKKKGFSENDFHFVQLCEPIPEKIKKSKANTWKYVLPFAQGVQAYLEGDTRPKITLGDLATRTVVGRACAITKVRGTLLEDKVYPMLSPAYCRTVLEQRPIFDSDMATLNKLYNSNFDLSKMGTGEKNYFWCTDLGFLIKNPPQLIAIDTETTGLRFTTNDFQLLTVQIAYNNTDVAVCPWDETFWPGEFDFVKCFKLREQIKAICENPKIRKAGHNVNYEIGALKTADIELKGVLGDTQLMAWCVDENMTTKTLDDVTRRWVPEMAGYNDQLNILIDKSNMRTCPPEQMLPYGAGDAQATYRVFWKLWELLRSNSRMYNVFLKLKMPGLKAFEKMSNNGIMVNSEYLSVLKEQIGKELVELNQKLLAQVPKAVIRKHLEAKKEPKFSRAAFVRDILFSDIGFNLQPVVFTKGTKDNDVETQVPSTSAKDHLPYFDNLENAAGDFVRDFMDYTKLAKLYSTYICDFEADYVHVDGKIHSQFNLHTTVTGRTSSRGPNCQNFPARGKYAKIYKKLFVASPGYKYISADLSQIELRLIAWESRDPRMLAAYRNGEDIHKITAMAVSGHTPESWAQLPKESQKLLRYRAKAVNFGLVYGMGPKKFRRFAKTDYQLDLTEKQAQDYYNAYHALYPNIKLWQNKRIREAHENGYVTSLHGVRRNVPSVFNKDSFIRSQAERQAVNSPIQGLGSDLGVLAIARLSKQCDPDIMRPVAFIHDDIILEVKDGYEELGVNTLLWVLNNPPLKELFNINPPIPILGEPDAGLNLGEMYELYDLKPEDRPYWLPEFNINPQKPEFWNDELDSF